jgi:hypothetical protein
MPNIEQKVRPNNWQSDIVVLLCDLGNYFACSAKVGIQVDELACFSEASRQRAV